MPLISAPAQDSVLFAGVHRVDGTLTTSLPFSDNSGDLVPSYPGDDWEALRSFLYFHDVRRLGIVRFSSFLTLWCQETLTPYNRTRDLR